MRQNNSAIEKRIGAKITEIRLSQKLTQAQLAEKVNVSNETISRLERGVTMPSLRTLGNIAQTLGISLSKFFDFGDHPPEDPLFERKLSKLNALLRDQNLKEVSLVYEVLKSIFKKMND